jgi:RNA polymerase sigma factor (sigma-70 family)
MSDSVPAEKLIDSWRAGDRNAAEAIHQRYAQRLCALIESRMGDQLRRRVGAEDIVQSVFRTFFRRAGDGQFHIDHTSSLWHLLVGIGLNKVRQQAEFHQAGKRNMALEQHENNRQLSPEAISHEPGPDEAAAVADVLVSVMSELTPSEIEVIRLCLAGFAPDEIVDRVGCSRWTVRRVRDRVGARLNERLNSE